MPKQSAGLLLFRVVAGNLEVLLVHPGGPFWAKKDDGSWSIPKGELSEGEDPFEAAIREFKEELGSSVIGKAIPLKPLRQPSGKIIYAWGVNGDFDTTTLKSNTFSIEWPPKSGQQREFPEVDRAAWFEIEEAKRKIHQGQVPLMEELERMVSEKRVYG
jgi:predicted NUDIX family NTP pyrophosphohydrolase